MSDPPEVHWGDDDWGDDTRTKRLIAENQRLREAVDILRDASYQSHSGHWDATQQGGAGCPECIRARELRDKADAIMNC